MHLVALIATHQSVVQLGVVRNCVSIEINEHLRAGAHTKRSARTDGRVNANKMPVQIDFHSLGCEEKYCGLIEMEMSLAAPHAHIFGLFIPFYVFIIVKMFLIQNKRIVLYNKYVCRKQKCLNTITFHLVTESDLPRC